MQCAREYMSKNTYTSVLTVEQQKEKKIIQQRINNGEILITYTDKDSRIAVCTPEQYKEAANVHISKDTEIEWSEVNSTITLFNRTAKSLQRIFMIGNSLSNSQQDRIIKAITTRDSKPPPVSFMW